MDMILASKTEKKIIVVKNFNLRRCRFDCGWIEDYDPERIKDGKEISLSQIKDLYDKRISFRPVYWVENGVIFKDFEFGTPGNGTEKHSPKVFHPKDLKIKKELKEIRPVYITETFYISIYTEYSFNDGFKDQVISETREFEYQFPFHIECARPCKAVKVDTFKWSRGEDEILIELCCYENGIFRILRKTGSHLCFRRNEMKGLEWCDEIIDYEKLCNGSLEKLNNEILANYGCSDELIIKIVAKISDIQNEIEYEKKYMEESEKLEKFFNEKTEELLK